MLLFKILQQYTLFNGQEHKNIAAVCREEGGGMDVLMCKMIPWKDQLL